MRSSRTKWVLAAMAAGMLVFTACGSSDNKEADVETEEHMAEDAKCEPYGVFLDSTTRINVTLNEWVVDLSQSEAPAGLVGFALEDVGEMPHEFVVVKGVTPTELPLADDGSLNEDALPEGALIGEVEPFPAGETCEGTFELAAGEYTLLCNIVEEEDDGTVEVHLKEGMVTTFTVT